MKVETTSDQWLWSYKYRIVEFHDEEGNTWYRCQKQVLFFFWVDALKTNFSCIDSALMCLQELHIILDHRKKKKKGKKYHYVH